MKKILFIMVSFFIFSSGIYSREHSRQTCDETFFHYGVDKNIKTNKGWLRVFANNKLQNYTKHTLTPLDKLYLKKCIEYEINTYMSRGFENTITENTQ
jgi:hypothetical protein